MTTAELDAALRRLETSLKALGETRGRLFHEAERATNGALEHMEQLIRLLEGDRQAEDKADAATQPDATTVTTIAA